MTRRRPHGRQNQQGGGCLGSPRGGDLFHGDSSRIAVFLDEDAAIGLPLWTLRFI